MDIIMQNIPRKIQNRIEIHRALELLGDYHAELIKTSEKLLSIEIERIIRVLKSRFFQALIDIQEYYRITITERQNKFLVFDESVLHNESTVMKILNTRPDQLNNEEYKKDSKKKEIYEEIVIVRGNSGLGFSISGGIDNSQLENDHSVYVTKITPGGPASVDGRLQIHDAIKKVNNVSLAQVTHATAVNILKEAGDEVKLLVQRQKKNHHLQKIELVKEKDGFGFSIAGGIENQHFPGKNGIFITKIINGGAAHKNGKLKIGCELIAVENSLGEHSLVDVTHDEAVKIIKSSGEKIVLFTRITSQPVSQLKFPSQPAEHPLSTKDQFIEKTEIDEDFCNKGKISYKMDINHGHQERKDYTRIITLLKGTEGFGFKIVGGYHNEPVLISNIVHNGPAFLDKRLQVGDKIVRVNNTDFSNISHDKAVEVLKTCADSVTLVVKNDDLNNIFQNNERGLDEKKKMCQLIERTELYMRALYNSDFAIDDEDSSSKFLTFHFGDILQIINLNNENWWQAKKIDANNQCTIGLIPSLNRMEKYHQSINEKKTEKFEKQLLDDICQESVLSRKQKKDSYRKKFSFFNKKDETIPYFPQRKHISTDELLYRLELPDIAELTMIYLERDAENDSDEPRKNLDQVDNSFFYETVEQIKINYIRPVIIVGPLKHHINQCLITLFPENFEKCIPHTTRLKKDDEINGKDYYFVLSRKEMESDIKNHLFIEAGQYNDHLYGTSLATVKDVVKKGKHCLLDVNENAIKRLYAAQIYPISLYVKIKSLEVLKKMYKNLSEEQAKEIFLHFMKVEQEYTEYFTDMIDANIHDNLCEEVKKVIEKHSQTLIWISSKLVKP